MRLRLSRPATSGSAVLAFVAALLAGVLLLPARSAYAIEGGEPADQTTTQFVARLDFDRGWWNDPSTGTCTGSLVAPKLVLTAAHCIRTYRPSDWTVTFSYGTTNSEKRDVARVYSYSPNAGASRGISVDDLAVLELKDAVSDRQPVSLDTDTNTVTQADGAWVTELGYGTFKDNTKTLPLPGAPEQDHLVYTIKRGGQLFMGAPVDFSTTFHARTDPPALLVAIDPGYDKAGDVPSGRCMEGDSGGPLIYNRPSGGSVLLGVLSLTDGKPYAQGLWNCEYTRVDNGDPYRIWLDSMIATRGG